MSTKLFTKNLHPYISAAKGHQKQERQNIQSTKPKKVYNDEPNIIRVNIDK